jgi:polysaccharide export outer membrane protein
MILSGICLLLLACGVRARQQQPAERRAAAPDSSAFNANLPAQPLGANDLIAVAVYDAPEFSRTVRVSDDGFIRLPMLKQRVKADGMLPAAMETAIAEALVREKLLIEPFVTVTVAEYQSRPISVSGAVRTPLVFQADMGRTTLLEAITKAQGLREDAGQEILVSSSQPGPDGKPLQLTRRINARSLFDASDPGLNLQLYGGEEIRVPEVGKIYVVGNVKKPGAFPVQSGADTTVLQLLALSEGLDNFYENQAFIYRREASGAKNEIPIQLKSILQRKAPDVPLVANDILYIPDSRRKHISSSALEKGIIFGTTVAAGAIIYGMLAH